MSYKKLQEQIKQAWDEYVAKNRTEPTYANCRVRFDGEVNSMDVCIKLYDDLDAQDNLIFFYCTGLNDFLSLCDPTEADEFLVTEFTDFSDEI